MVALGNGLNSRNSARRQRHYEPIHDRALMVAASLQRLGVPSRGYRYVVGQRCAERGRAKPTSC